MKLESEDHDVFARRVDPATMTALDEPVLVAGGEAEPGSQGAPIVAALAGGRAIVAYQAVQPDGRCSIAARLITGKNAAPLPD